MPFELIYESEEEGNIHWLYQQEVETMRSSGLTVRTVPSHAATRLLRRGLIVEEEDFPSDSRYIQNGKTFTNLSRIDIWYPIIADLTISTMFCNKLDNEAVSMVRDAGWNRCFIKNSIKSLVDENPLESVWPDVSFESMTEQFTVNPHKGPYAIRQYLPPEYFIDERRYWVVGDNIHHSSLQIPAIVYEAKERLDVFGGVFYAIDATPRMVVEINGGEASDRKTDNTAEDFARWIKHAFHND
jgi:hypothetical protein